ncbi:hypothetical protein NliqN6_5431 [Naganishia liquefaciens]|uniref:START domain-containing protein n=1 Tax=Naganishia liquefaciens TaxID=104408 RepID=A0A8H3TZH4_9TREE|nr:hypothetical protein NliqN6_5431 [Naganishia liquefaciens]
MTQIAHLGDGSTLNQAWESALTKAVAEFKHLVSSAGSKSWKLVQPGSGSTTPQPPTAKSPPTSPIAGYPFPDLTNAAKAPRTSDVVVHRRSGKTGDTYRATLEVPLSYFGERGISIETFARAINTPEAWRQWQKLVEDASTLDLLDIHTRINSVRFKLGWPSSPRDAITIARTYEDDSSLIDISTSLPRMPDEPAYLRPAPPYVRSAIKLLAWCVQIQRAPTQPPASSKVSSPSDNDVLRITCFWNWNPQGTWAVGASVPQHLPALLVGLVDFVTSDRAVIPGIAGYGRQISIHELRYDPTRNMLNLDYAVVPESCSAKAGGSGVQAVDVGNFKTQNQKSIVLEMSGTHSWDIQLQRRSSSESGNPWRPTLSHSGYDSLSKTLHLHIDHQEPKHDNDLIRILATVERTSGNPGDVWLNGALMTVTHDAPKITEQADPLPHLSPRQIEDGASVRSDYSLDSSLIPDSVEFKGRSRSATLRSFSGIDVALHRQPSMMLARNRKTARGRSPAQEKSIGSLIRRNYIYFTSFLQEPDAKWRQISESKGVTVHQLNSIDPTLLVHRAEAVFVGVSLLDLWAILSNFGTRKAWSKTFENAELLEHVNEMSELWHIHHRPGKSMAARDALLLRTTYKSPDSIHIFGLSVDDKTLFPELPDPDEPHSIRQTIALQGWSLEKLSPNTVHVTLIEQADPRGWTTKGAMQQALISAVSGLGEFAIKSGAPPAVARLEGAQLAQTHLNIVKQVMKVKYESATSWTTVPAARKPGSLPPHIIAETPGIATPAAETAETPLLTLEETTRTMSCTIRCDSGRYWPFGVDIVVDPPASSVTALRRHKLAEPGGGLWATVTHSKHLVGTESVSLTLRPRTLEDKRDRPGLSVNGSVTKVDTEDLDESELQLMKKQKRSKPTRRPLDQPPTLPVLRRQATSQSSEDSANKDHTSGQAKQLSPVVASNVWSRFSSPLTSIYSSAAQSSRNLFLAKPLSAAQQDLMKRAPIDALGVAFEQLFRIHVDRFSESTSSDAQWQQVSKGPAGIVECKTLPFVSPNLPVYRSSRIIQNYSAPEIISVIKSGDHRKVWDAKLMENNTLQSFGHGVTVDWSTQSMAFPLRPRGFITASMTVKGDDAGTRSPLSSTSATPTATLTFHVTTSNFDRADLMKHADRFNPQGYGIGNVVLEGWILETLDPYSHDHYPVPSTRCMYVTAVDFGYLPLAANNMANAALPQRLSAIEKLLKSTAASLPMLQTPKSRLVVGKELLHARQSQQPSAYALQSPSARSALIQSQATIDGGFECILYLPAASQATVNGLGLEAEIVPEEQTETLSVAETGVQISSVAKHGSPELGTSPPERPSSRLLSSPFASLPRIRSPLSNVSIPKFQQSLTPILCEVVFERSGGASFDISFECVTAEGTPPVTLPVDFSNGNTTGLQLYIDRAPAPVLRSALNENDVYCIKVSADSQGLASHPLGDLEPQESESDLPPRILRVRARRREVAGDHPFMMNGRPIEVRDNLQGPLSPAANRAEWPRIVRVGSARVSGTCAPLARDASIRDDTVVPREDIEIKQGEDTDGHAATNAAAASSSDPPATPVRMNSIYRYLTQPVNLNRFSWPISGYPSPAIKSETAPLPVEVPPPAPRQDQSTSTDNVGPIAGESVIALADATASSGLSTPALIVLAVLLSFALGFMSRTLLMNLEDFVNLSLERNGHSDGEWTEFRRLLQVPFLGRYLVLGIADRARQ